MGVVKTQDSPEVTEDFTEGSRNCPSEISGVVESETLKIGGTYSIVDDTLVNYKGGDGSWSNVVTLPKGAQFSLRVLSRGSAMNFARIEVTVHEGDFTLQELNCFREVKGLLEKYPKEMVLESIELES